MTKATVAIEATDGIRSIVTVPEGAIIKVTSGPASEKVMGTVAVLWEGHMLAMFAVDIERRGTEVAARSAGD